MLGFAGTAQASNIHSFGADQEVTPPSDDIAVGPNDLVEAVNSSIVVLTRTGTILGSDDLNALMDVDPGYYSSDPRVIFDVETGRFWVTVTEVPELRVQSRAGADRCLRLLEPPAARELDCLLAPDLHGGHDVW